MGLVALYAYNLRVSLLQVREQLQKTGETLTSTRETLTDLRSRHDTLSVALATTEKSLEERNRQLEASKSEAEDTRGKLSTASEDLKRSRSEIHDLTQELAAERALATENRIANEQCVQELQGKLDSVVVDGERTREELKAVGEQLVRRTATLHRVEENLTEAERDFASAQDSLNEERHKVSTLEKARAAAVQDIRKALGELRDLTFTLEDEKERTKQLEHEVNLLKVRMTKGKTLQILKLPLISTLLPGQAVVGWQWQNTSSVARLTGCTWISTGSGVRT